MKIRNHLWNLLLEVPTILLVALAFLIWLLLAGAARAKELPPNQLDCLARAIYWEARGEPVEGQVAVAQVVLNRVRHPSFPSTPCAVISQRRGTVCQFSWFCTSLRHRRPPNSETWRQAQEVARFTSVMNPQMEVGPLYFHARRMRQRWRHLTELAEVGDHIFYGDINGRR